MFFVVAFIMLIAHASGHHIPLRTNLTYGGILFVLTLIYLYVEFSRRNSD